MADTIFIISKVLPVIFLIIIGYLFQKTKFLAQSTITDLKKIIINISLPAVLFLAFAETDFKSRYILIFLAVFLGCGLMLLLGMVFKRIFKSDNSYLPSVFSGFETGMMGYSIFAVVYGGVNTYKLAIVDLGQVTFVFFVLVSYLQRLNGKSARLSELSISFLKSPIILSILSGILVGSTGVLDTAKSLSLSNSVLETIRLLSNLTLPTICIIIGFELYIDFGNLRRPVLIVMIRLIILIGMAVLINTLIIEKALNLDNTFKTALYTMFLLPPPFVIPIFMENKHEKDKQFILNIISVHIVLSLAAFMVLISVS